MENVGGKNIGKFSYLGYLGEETLLVHVLTTKTAVICLMYVVMQLEWKLGVNLPKFNLSIYPNKHLFYEDVK